MKIVIVEPGKVACEGEINNDLKSLQRFVDGGIESLSIEEGVDIVCNNEGKINGLSLNRALCDDTGEVVEIIAGTFIIVGVNNNTGEYTDLTDEQIERYIKQYYWPEFFYVSHSGIIISRKNEIKHIEF